MPTSRRYSDTGYIARSKTMDLKNSSNKVVLRLNILVIVFPSPHDQERHRKRHTTNRCRIGSRSPSPQAVLRNTLGKQRHSRRSPTMRRETNMSLETIEAVSECERRDKRGLGNRRTCLLSLYLDLTHTLSPTRHTSLRPHPTSTALLSHASSPRPALKNPAGLVFIRFCCCNLLSLVFSTVTYLPLFLHGPPTAALSSSTSSLFTVFHPTES